MITREMYWSFNRTSMLGMLVLLGVVIFAVLPVFGMEPDAMDDTLLIFVGEDVGMLSLASRREESAWEAPAVASVISEREIRESGARNLGQLLQTVPGFCIAEKEYGYKPYLRGVQDSVLFLYDTVPLGLESVKSYNPLGYNLSLSSVKQVEIIRGPGSVLWGPDAFTGIVNVVPKTGYDLQGVETGVAAAGPDIPSGVFLNMGQSFGSWSSFLSVDAKQGREDDRLCNLSSFWGDGARPVDPDERYAETRPDVSRYLDLSFRLDHEKDFSIVGRVSDAKNAYSISNGPDAYTWKETMETPSWLLKAEGSRKIGTETSLRLSGYMTATDVDHTIIDTTLHHEEETFFVEGMLDRTCFDSAGLFTVGTSYRTTSISGVPVWDSYLPDYFGSDNTSFLPYLSEDSIDGDLISVFSQYRHSLGDLDLSAGIRYDSHNLYSDSVSFNLGAVWSPSKTWVFKSLLGTAYRTPFIAQMEEGASLDPEQITSLNLQSIWKFSSKSNLSLTLFGNRIDNHVLEDIFSGAGLSTANSQDIVGVELSVGYSPMDTLHFSSSLTLLDNDGPDETYLYNDYTFIRQDGTEVKHYSELNYGYDPGSKFMFNITARWTPLENTTLVSTLNYNSSRNLYFLDDQTSVSCPDFWVLNAGLLVSNLFDRELDLDVSVRNLFNATVTVPGTYTKIEGEPVSIIMVLRKRW